MYGPKNFQGQFSYKFKKSLKIYLLMVATLLGNLEFDNLGKKTWNLGNFQKNLEF